MFFFQSMFQTVYNGITGSNTLTAVTDIAEAILLLTTLFAVYEAYARGGDARSLALVGVRFLFMGLLITQYPNVFIKVNNAANNLAQQISPTDVWTNFQAQVANYLQSPSGFSAWWNLVIGGTAATVSLITQAIAVELFPITYALFSFFYSMYGAILYVVGPLVLALYPAFGIGHLARTYMVNLLIWNSWGILYAVLSQLLTLMSAGSLTTILNAQSFGGAFQGASQMLLLSLSAILLSLMIALIPFIAKHVISGDVGSTLYAVLGAAATALTALGAAESARAGALAGGGGPGDPDPPGPPGGGGGAGGGGGQAKGSSNTAPTPPSPTNAPSLDNDPAYGVGPGSDYQKAVAANRQARAGGGGGGGFNQRPGGPNSGGYPIGLGPQNALQSGLYAMPRMVGWAVGRTQRAMRSSSNSSNEEA